MKNILKKFLAFGLSSALCLTAVSGTFATSAYAEQECQNYTADFSRVETGDTSIQTSSPIKWFEDDVAEWQVCRQNASEWSSLAVSKTSDGRGIKMINWGGEPDKQEAEFLMKLKNGSLSGLLSASSQMNFSGYMDSEKFKDTMCRMEVRYLVNATRDSYVAFGVDAKEGKLYTSVDGRRNDIGTISESTSTASVNITVEEGKIKYVFGSLTGALELTNIDERIDETVYPVIMAAKLPKEMAVSFSDINISFAISDGVVVYNGENFTSTISGDQSGTIDNCVTNNNASWDFVGTGWYNGVCFDYGSVKMWGGGGSDCTENLLCNLKTGTNEFTGIKKSSVDLTMNGEGQNAEVRYLLSDKTAPYITLGVDAHKKPYYVLGSGTKVYPEDTENISLGNNIKISLRIIGKNVYYTIGSWNGKFNAPNVDVCAENCMYHAALYVTQNGSSVHKGNVSFTNFNISYTVAQAADFTETFDEYTSDNARIGADNAVSAVNRFTDKPTVVASNDKVTWEPSFVTKGRSWNESESKADIYSNTYIDGELKSLAIMGSYDPSAVNMYLSDKVFDISRLKFDLTNQSQRRTSVRFLVTDDEQSYYEIGLSGWADNDRFKESMNDGTHCENRFYIREVRNTQGDRQTLFNGETKRVWAPKEEAYTTGVGYVGTFNITIEPNDAGFSYKAVDKSNGNTVFEGVYTDSTGKRFRPDPRTNVPVLSLMIGTAETDKRAYLDNVKLWYTSVCDISARADNDKIAVTIAPNQINADSINLIAAYFDANGNLIGIAENTVTDMTQGATDVKINKAEGAKSAKVYVWKGSTENPKPITAQPLAVNFE